MPAGGHRLVPSQPCEPHRPDHLDEERLDEERLRLYALALHLSLVAGPLRLLEGDFPDREPMLAIVEHNLEEAVAFARPAH